MKALVMSGTESVKVLDVPQPDCAGKVLIRVAYAGICGSDLSIFAGKHPRAQFPLIAGHEFSGRVERIGERVSTSLKPGDSVVVNPLYSCGVCRACLAGNPHVCDHLKLIGIDCDGGFAEYAAVPPENVFLLPEGMDLQMAALVEPVAVVLHGMRMLKPGFYSSALVTGAGPMGLLSAILLRNAGVSKLMISEISKTRLARAQALGFDTIDLNEENVRQAVERRLEGTGIEIVVEASGSAAAMAEIPAVAASRATVLVLSVFKQPAPVDLRQVNFKELSLLGSRVYTQLDFADAITYTAENADALRPVISHTFDLSDAAEALRIAYGGLQDPMKVSICCGKEER